MTKVKYTSKFLEKVLIRHGHGHDVMLMTPQWSQFAVQLLILEKLDELKK